MFFASISPYSYPNFIIGVCALLLGLFIWLKNIKEKKNFLFFVFAFLVSVWLFTYSIIYSLDDPDVAVILFKIGYSAVMFLAVLGMHFSFVVFNLERKLKKLIIAAYLITFIFVLLHITTSLIMKGVYKYFWGYYPNISTFLGILFVVLFVSFVAFALLYCWRVYFLKKKELSAQEANKLKYVLLGTTIAPLASPDFLAGFGIELYPFGFFFFFLFLVVMAYAVFRYRALEIETVIHKTFLWLVTSLALGSPLFLIYIFLGKWLTKLNSLAVALILLGLVYFFSWYLSKVKPRIDHLFRRRAYDYQKTLIELGEKIATTIDLAELIKKFLKGVNEIFYPQKSLLLIKKYIGYEIKGGGRQNRIILPKEHSMAMWIKDHPQPLEKESLETDPKYKSIKDDALLWFRKNEIETIIPLILEKRVLGLLGLAKKTNLKPYTQRDIELLENLGRISGLALANALQHQKLIHKEEKRAQQLQKAKKLAENERDKTLSIIHNFADGLMVLSASGRIVLVNPEAERMIKLSRRKLEGKRLREFKDAYFLGPVINMILKKGEIKKVSRQEFSPQQGLIIEITTIPLVERREVRGNLVIFRDISREKTVERLKTEFVSLAAHQLRTPLSEIKWSLKMFLDGDFGAVNKDQKEFIEKTYASNERMIVLVNDLLNITRIEEGRYVTYPTSTDLEGVVQKVIKFLKNGMKKKQISIEFEKPKEKLSNLLLDAEKIELAIQNLVENAIRYNKIKGKIIITLKQNNKEVEFSIQDSGAGIPKNQQERIFTKFFRADNVMRLETEGNGLGLFIVKNIIEAHKGKIWFESEEGRGTTFYFTLPIKSDLSVKTAADSIKRSVNLKLNQTLT